MIPLRLLVAPLFVVSFAAGCGSSDSAAGDVAPGPGGPADDGCPTETASLYDADAADGGIVTTPPVHTPRWAFRPWISKDISTADDTRAFVKGFADRDIPVGVVVLDSPWETNYNSFVPNPSRYPAFSELLSELHGKDIRTVLWITQMVNDHSFDLEAGGDAYDGPSPNYDLGARCGFYVNDGATYGWWKGSGSAVDFFNPRALAWWHSQQDLALDLGIDGWKLDFGDSYVRTDTVKTAAGEVPHQAYSEAYYHDFYAHGVARRGAEFVTMSRAWDGSYEFPGRFFAKKEDAPVAWMGDNRRDFVGLEDALREMFVSARAGYAVLGSDVGGYLDHDDENLASSPEIPFDTDVFARWTAVGALSPLMQLHGRANIAPWTVPDHVDETVALYRYWAKLHDALVPFFYSLAEERAGSLVDPVGDQAAWEGDFRYQLGSALLVAPVLDAKGSRGVDLPAGARWVDWWNPGGDAIAGGARVEVDTTDRAKIPLYLREGAVLPLEVVDDANGLGTSASKGALTLLVWPAPATQVGGGAADVLRGPFAVHDADATTHVAASADASGATVSLDVVPRDAILAIRTDAKPSKATLGAELAWVADRAAFDAATTPVAWWDASRRSTWVRVPASKSPKSVVLAP